MFTASNGCKIQTQHEYQKKRLEERTRPNAEKRRVRREIERRQEQRELDAQFDYLLN
ncbi:hypothetical protein [Vibrio furnissii]|uniref:hypothetical protein n=1 Tax=Vibrio furnissii TaxID=29494 RepID=UPI001EEC8A48|nr:hypothetical protein [Vibrio furnissii]MCG6216253.1 hypothetical protein [Vibrio furnissii]